MSLNVMVLESEPGAAHEASAELIEAGHVVLRCHDPVAPAFPCRGLLDEDVVRRALMERALVVAGTGMLDPYDGFEARLVDDRTYDVVSSCEAAAAELTAYVRRAEAVISETLGADRAATASVSVTRHGGGLRVNLRGVDDATNRARRTAVVRIVGAMRGIDRSARTIDVAVGGSD